jgi:hypothetical protein
VSNFSPHNNAEHLDLNGKKIRARTRRYGPQFLYLMVKGVFDSEKCLDLLGD